MRDGWRPLELPLADVMEDPGQPRRFFSQEALESLAVQIRASKVRSPISVRPRNADGKYVINHGARRYRASLLAGQAIIPGFIDDTHDDYDRVAENIQREDLAPIEIALFIARRIALGDKKGEIAARLGQQPWFVSEHLPSRKLVAWEVHACEGGDEAAALIERACWREHRSGTKPLVLHADNGAAQKAHTLKSKLETLGITPSHSRPGVSDDNAHIEAWFRTCKYSPGYPPRGFEDIEQAQQWVLKFVTRYNGVHLHSGLSYVTPEQRHSGCAEAILMQRRAVYTEARARHPLRWKRAPRAWQVAGEVWLNPPSKLDQQRAA